MSVAGPGGLPEDPAERLVALVHDLRTPLTVVAGFADLLESRGEALSPEQRTDFIARIAESARQMRDILDTERESRHVAGSGPPGP